MLVCGSLFDLKDMCDSLFDWKNDEIKKGKLEGFDEEGRDILPFFLFLFPFSSI